MPGYQEIVIISAIVLGVIFIPRMMAPRKTAPRSILRPKRLPGAWRAALAISVVYPLIVAAFIRPWQTDPVPYVYTGPVPVAMAWLMYWVLRGFKRK